MRRTFFSKIMIVVMFLFAASAYSASAATSIKGFFLVDGQWVSGTLYGDGILLNGDIATARPPAALVLDGGGGILSSDQPIVIYYRANINKIAISSFLSGREISFGSDGEISINSDVWLDASIYDLSGRTVCSASGETGIQINGNDLFSNGSYVMKIVNKEGQVTMVSFIFSNGEFSVSNLE